MTAQPVRPPRRRRGAAVAALGLVAAALVWAPPSPARGDTAPPGRFPQVGTLPLVPDPEETGRSGWLILNPASRRGYQVFEVARPSAADPRTVVQSFDLDTLRPLRRAEFAGIPLTGGIGNLNAAGHTQSAAEVLHAVNPEGGRIYLALNSVARDNVSTGDSLGRQSDGKRPLARFVAIDEERFDAGAADFAASFREPVGQERLRYYWPVGMKVSRHATTGGLGRLLVLYAAPTGLGGDHTLVQWDPSGLRFYPEAPMETRNTGGPTIHTQLGVQQVATAGPERRLASCAGATVATSGGEGHGQYQWGLLVTGDAVWTGCQASQGAGGAVRAPLAADGTFDPTAPDEFFRMSNRVVDVLADDGGARLLLKSWGGGHTWWSFDTGQRRFTGAVAAKVSDAYHGAVGLDPTTGRLYQLMQDYQHNVGGRNVAFRGGFSYSDTRLDPPPPLENARPDLAYPGGYAIRVDPPTRRVFVRFGDQTVGNTPRYPGVDSVHPAPPEQSYRVLLDNVALTGAPPPPDDSAFTVDTAESALTRASYLGTGSGYGARTLLVGGLDAATDRKMTAAWGTCAKDNRELLAGAVRGVEVSDLSTRAEAAGLDADDKTRAQAPSLLGTCHTNPSAPRTDELAFDEGDDGDNRYRSACIGDTAGRRGSAPKGKMLSRKDFSAKSSCRQAHGAAEAAATGALRAPFLTAADDTFSGTPALRDSPAAGVQVGYAHSEVSVVREAGNGITVKVDSIARDVVVPGVGTIGLVRGEATVRSTGRRGGARVVYRRTVCDVDFPNLDVAPCLDDKGLKEREEQFSRALGTRGRIRFRDPDPDLLAGSASGYGAGVRRPVADGFEDARIAQDLSTALPAMELVLFNGDGTAGAGRQFVQLAGVEAGTSYGVACLFGQRDDGRCAGPDDGIGGGDDGLVIGATGDDGEGDPGVVTVTEYQPGQVLPGRTVVRTRPLWRRLAEAPARLVQDALRLLFANPREFGLMAAVWALLYVPCWLGERRRSLGALRARRAASA